MNLISELKRLPETKAQVEAFAEGAIQEVISGERNPLEFETLLKAMETMIEIIRKDQRVKDAIESEAMKYPDKSFDYGNAIFTKSGRTTYEFEVCEDIQWEMADVEAKKWTNIRKEREAFLKALKEPVADISTGGVINPPATRYSLFVSVKLK
jgi:hypothetical protein